MKKEMEKGGKRENVRRNAIFGLSEEGEKSDGGAAGREIDSQWPRLN